MLLSQEGCSKLQLAPSPATLRVPEHHVRAESLDVHVHLEIIRSKCFEHFWRTEDGMGAWFSILVGASVRFTGYTASFSYYIMLPLAETVCLSLRGSS